MRDPSQQDPAQSSSTQRPKSQGGPSPASHATDANSATRAITSSQHAVAGKRTLHWRTAAQWFVLKLAQAAFVVGVFLALLWSMGFAMRQGWFPASSTPQASANQTVATQRYICPMMCVPPTTQPGRCPVCGMELVATTANSDDEGVAITLQPAHRRLIGLRTATAKMKLVNRTIRTVGSIRYDESQLANIAAFVDGRLEKLFADYVGVPVNTGDDLALIYSPELYTAQAEYLSTLDQRSNRFVDSARLNQLAEERLLELGMTESQIAELKTAQEPRSRIRIKSPQNGTVIEKLAIEGDYVKTGQNVYRVADLSTVWMMLDLFPDDAARVRFGQIVEAEIASAPGEIFTGRVAFVDPTVDEKTRTVRVRVEMPNMDGKLRPGDYASARITVPAVPREQIYDPELAGKFISPMHPKIIRDRPGQCPICDMDLIPTLDLGFALKPLPEQRNVTVPRDAVLMAGDSSVVYVETDPGRFEVRRVSLGALTADRAIIAEGLNAGEVVATQGNFLLDSQSQLAGNPSLLDPAKAPAYPSGPLQFVTTTPVTTLASESEQAFDRVYEAYFDIQATLASDSPVPSPLVDSLIEAVDITLGDKAVPVESRQELTIARGAADRLNGPIEEARIAFRTVSHALIKTLHRIRTTKTRNGIFHFYCPMVPSGGGDWMQSNHDLKNPYWGAMMLTCGELAKDLSLDAELNEPQPEEDPFDGMEMQSLDFEN